MIALEMAVVEVVTEAKGLEDLRDEWRNLLAGCPTATPFQSHEWLATWWQLFGRGRLGRRLFVITVRDLSRTLVGLAPMMFSPWYGLPLRRLSFLGEGASDYHDFLAREGREEEVCEAVYGFLALDRRWQVGDLNQLREGGLLTRYPPAGASRLRSLDRPQEVCPYVTYPAAPDSADRWTALLCSLGKKMRYNIGYYERALRKTHEVQIGAAGDGAEVDRALTALFELHQRRWNQRWMPGVFGSRRVQEFHRAVAPKMLEQGMLRLHTLTLDGEIEAVLYCMALGDRTCYYQAGFEPSLARLSLGTILTAHAIRMSIEEGRDEFDFLRGDEPYKERWTAGASRMNTRRLIAKSGAAMGLAARIAATEHAVETRAKHWMHHRSETKPKSGEKPS